MYFKSTNTVLSPNLHHFLTFKFLCVSFQLPLAKQNFECHSRKHVENREAERPASRCATMCFTFFVLKHENSRIDTSWILLNKIKIVAIYSEPQTSSSLWKKWFQQLNLSETTTENVIIMGDFNINYFHDNHSLLRWFHRINFSILNKTQPTTQHKTHLDWVVSNSTYKTGTYASYFSYHHPIWAQLPACSFFFFCNPCMFNFKF